MNRFFYFILLLLVAYGCGKDEPNEINPVHPPVIPVNPVVNPEAVERTVIVYAVNRSSLSYNFEDDLSEMLRAMAGIDMDKYQLLVYKTNSASECGLYRVAKDKEGKIDVDLVRSYSRDVTSTHPDRIREVLEYALDLYPNSAYDLIFWGHGMSWKPYFSSHDVIDRPMSYGYGGEYNETGNTTMTDWTEIDELAEVVPDHAFDTVWFDCCYMSGIEVIYEFRDKCDTFVGYPSEVWDEGMAYDVVLPYLLREKPDVTGAAKAFYNYYDIKRYAATVAVFDMSLMEELAVVASDIVGSGEIRPDEKTLLNYSRTRTSPFYDFTQFFSQTALLNGCPDLAARLESVMDKAVIYHDASENDFNNRPWNFAVSGISTHFYKGLDTRNESYYRTLDWYKRVY